MHSFDSVLVYEVYMLTNGYMGDGVYMCTYDTYIHVYIWIQALQLEHRSLHVEQSEIHLTVYPIPSCFSNSIDHRSCCSCFTVVVIFSAVLCLLFISVTLCVDFSL